MNRVRCWGYDMNGIGVGGGVVVAYDRYNNWQCY